jgi:hypothetical protein
MTYPRGIFEVVTAGGPVAPISESRERALKTLGYEPITPQTLQRYGITLDQLDAYFKPARDAQTLQRLLESFLDKIYEDSSPLSVDILDSIDDPTVREKIINELSSIVLHVIRSRGLRVPFPKATAQSALRTHVRKIAPTAPKEAPSQLVEVPDLTDRELEYLRLGRTDITADMKRSDALLAIQRLHGQNRIKISDMGKDEAEVERVVRQELKELGVNGRRQIVFRLLGAIRNAKIKKTQVLDKEDELWLGATPDKVMDKANSILDSISSDEGRAPSEVGEVDYQTIQSDAKALVQTLKKLREYTTSIKVMDNGEYGSSHPDLQRDIEKIQNFKKPSVPDAITGPLSAEIDRLSKTLAHRKVLEDMIDPLGQVYADPESIKKRYQYADAALLDRYKKMRDRQPGEPYTLPTPSGEVYTPEGRFLRTQTLAYMSRMKNGDALKSLEDTIKDVQDRISAADDLQAMKSRGELDKFEQLSAAFTKNISDEVGAVTESTDAESWDGVLDLMHMLHSQLSTLFERPDVVADLKPLWDRGSGWMHRTTMETVDKGFDGIFSKKKDLGDTALSRAVKDKNPAIFLGYLSREPLLNYISHKLYMLEREPKKYLKGPLFDQTAKMVSSFLQGTSRAMSALNPLSMRRKALKGIYKLEDPNVDIGSSEKAESTSPVVKKAVWDRLREAAKDLSEKYRLKLDEKPILKKRLKTEKAPDLGHYRKRPSKMFGQVTLSGFFDKPDYVKGFVKALEDRSKMLVDAALRPDDPKSVKKTNPEEFKRKMGVDGLVAEVMGIEEKNIEDAILRRRLNSMMDERLDKSSQGLFDRDPDSGKIVARLEADKVDAKIRGVQNKYLPKLNALAQILNNPFPAIKRSLEGMSPDRAKEYEEALGKLQNLTPEEKEKALEAMRGKAEALTLMGKEHRFLSKNVLTPLMEGTFVKKDPISDDEYNAAAKDFKEIVARRGVKRPKDEEESPASFADFKKKLNHSIQMLFSPQAYSHSIIKNINVSQQVESILRSDPVKYDFDPKDREELMIQLIKRHRALLQIINEYRNGMDKDLEALRAGAYEDKDDRHKWIRSWQMQEKAVDKLEAEVTSVLNTLQKVESEYRSKTTEAPLDTVLESASDLLDYKLQPPSITLEDITKATNPDLLSIYKKKVESFRNKVELKRNEIEGYYKRLNTIKWDRAQWAKTPGKNITKEKALEILQQEDLYLKKELKDVMVLIKALNDKKVVQNKAVDPSVILDTVDSQVKSIHEGIQNARSFGDLFGAYANISAYRDLVKKAISDVTKILNLKGIRKESATTIDRPSKPTEYPVETVAPVKSTEVKPEKDPETTMPSEAIRRLMSKLYPKVNWYAKHKPTEGSSDVYLYDNNTMVQMLEDQRDKAEQLVVAVVDKIYEDTDKRVKKLIKLLGDKNANLEMPFIKDVSNNTSQELLRVEELRKKISKDDIAITYREEAVKQLGKVESLCKDLLKQVDSRRVLLEERDYQRKNPGKTKPVIEPKGLSYKQEPYQAQPGRGPSTPTPAGLVKTAAIEDLNKSSPEDILRDKAKAQPYDEEATRLKDMELLEYLFEGAGEELSHLREMSKNKFVKKDAIEARIKALEKTIQKLGKLQAIEVPVLGTKMPLKEVPYEFDKLSDGYFEDMAQARAQRKTLTERINEAKKRVGEVEQYYDTDTGEYKMTDTEKRSIMNIFYQGLFWAMQNYWNQQLGKGTKGGDSDLYFGERTQEPFWKIYETFKALGGVKSNPVYQKLLKTGDALLRADINDEKHRTAKGAYLDEIKKMEKKWVSLGYTEDEIEEAKKRNPYKHFKEQIKYLDSVKRQQNLIFKAIREVSDAKYVNHVLGEIAKKTDDAELKATIEKRQKEILGEVKTDTTKQDELKNEAPIDPESLKKALLEADNIATGKIPEGLKQDFEPGTETPAPTTKTAYDRSHPDFDLKILYGSVMQKTIASMLRL